MRRAIGTFYDTSRSALLDIKCEAQVSVLYQYKARTASVINPLSTQHRCCISRENRGLNFSALLLIKTLIKIVFLSPVF